MASQVLKFGYNDGVDATSTPEDIHPSGGEYTGQPDGDNADTVDVVSSSADDTGAGTGMRTIRLEGLGADWTEQGEDITLDGTTPVTTTQQWQRLYRAYGMSAGTAGTNAGEITATATATPAREYLAVPAGIGQSELAAWTVPDGRTAWLRSWSISAANSPGNGQEVRIAMAVRPYGSGCWLLKDPLWVSTLAGVNSFDVPGSGIRLPSRSDVKMRAMSGATASNLRVSGQFYCVLT